jgi:hypothetical protein
VFTDIKTVPADDVSDSQRSTAELLLMTFQIVKEARGAVSPGGKK